MVVWSDKHCTSVQEIHVQPSFVAGSQQPREHRKHAYASYRRRGCHIAPSLRINHLQLSRAALVLYSVAQLQYFIVKVLQKEFDEQEQL